MVPRPGQHLLDEAERSLHDALCVLSQTTSDSRVIYGGGWPEMQARAHGGGGVRGAASTRLTSALVEPPPHPTPPPAQMARVVDDLAARTPGTRSLAMAAFARALRQIPTIICDNAGE